ncbi:NAD(P)/FAD-dependent oxidoreductase [Fimbriimonas ginsengisoli]|uniref:Ferredoxin--NADP reductase n=1 Tax=Fimbriimonas ginsengisoli Gsoil 348 TaxID=661478 RepID=A0A068NX63_FIMGI|nr:NAD(P)/FAD-dependent oxidoreductase [Fimbriimonas ginsengisoli]AIE88083.1 Ferredoxin--NADP reductase [Fimbriimonas ginsengisoli Gsoil 348]
MNTVDVTIIGGGPCGLFASFYAGLRGMSVRIIDSLPELGGQLTALYPEKYVYDMPGFPKVLAKDLARELIRQGTQFETEVVLEETASALEKTDDGYLIRTLKGLELPTRTVIISAGAGAFQPTKIGVEREEDFAGKGIYYGVKDKARFAGKNIAIVGGGDSAFDWALNLEDVAGPMTLIHRRDVFKAHEDSVDKVKASRVEMKLWYAVKALHGDGEITGVTLENTQTKECHHHECDAVIVNIGFKSSLGPIKEWGLDIEKNQIKVDERYETNLPGVFAVGDVCSFPSKIKLIATGVGEAATAVCYAKTRLDPAAKLFPGHSSDMELPATH